jgi:hypothetical protein
MDTLTRPGQESTKSSPLSFCRRPTRVDWLVDFIPVDFEDASVLKFNHNADWFLDAPRVRPRVAAEKLLVALQTAERVSITFYPLELTLI